MDIITREDNITNEELYYRNIKSLKVKYIFIRIIVYFEWRNNFCIDIGGYRIEIIKYIIR